MGVYKLLNVTDHRDVILILIITTNRKQECIMLNPLSARAKMTMYALQIHVQQNGKRTDLEKMSYTQNNNYTKT